LPLEPIGLPHAHDRQHDAAHHAKPLIPSLSNSEPRPARGREAPRKRDLGSARKHRSAGRGNTEWVELELGASFSLKARRLPWVLLRIPKALGESIAAYVAVAGVLGGILGLVAKAPPLVLAGWMGAALAARYVRRVTAPHAGLERAFGPDWERRLAPSSAARLLPRRWSWRLPPSSATWARRATW
jgi:hypothetical protein